jgi:hypothetical protein
MKQLFVLLMNGDNHDNTFLGVYSNLDELKKAAMVLINSSDEYSDPELKFYYKSTYADNPATHKYDLTPLKQKVVFE